jgi:hypothetical protein
MWHYSRGLALAATGKPAEAAAELSAFETIAGTDAVKALDNPYFPGTAILQVARAVLAGKVAAAKPDPETALAELRRVVELESELPYMEPPFFLVLLRPRIPGCRASEIQPTRRSRGSFPR